MRIRYSVNTAYMCVADDGKIIVKYVIPSEMINHGLKTTLLHDSVLRLRCHKKLATIYAGVTNHSSKFASSVSGWLYDPAYPGLNKA